MLHSPSIGGLPSACPDRQTSKPNRRTPYERCCKAFIRLVEAHVRTLSLNNPQRRALLRLRIEAGAMAEGFDITPHQLARMVEVSLPTARGYLKAFSALGLAKEVSAHNRGAHKAQVMALDFTSFPSFADALRKPVAKHPSQASAVFEPKKVSCPSPEGNTSTLRSEDIPSRKGNNCSRKAPEAGAPACGASLGKGKGSPAASESLPQALLEQGARVIQEQLGLDPTWARKAVRKAAHAFASWEAFEAYVSALKAVLEKVRAKGSLSESHLCRLAYRRLANATDPRNRRKILREAGQAGAFLERLRKRRETLDQDLAGSALVRGCSALVDGMRVALPTGLPPTLGMTYLAWLKTRAALQTGSRGESMVALDQERTVRLTLVKGLEGCLSNEAKATLEQSLKDRLNASQLLPGTLVWKRAWDLAWTREVLGSFGVQEAVH